MNALTVFQTPNVHDKMASLTLSCHAALALTSRVEVSATARDCEVREFWQMPKKIGLGKIEGQARLLHDLANIELQATELALRSLCEFPEAPPELREELCALALDEGRHLGLCLSGLEDLGYRWGEWPIHINLWETVSPEDSLLDRLVIVHRYLEGAGLDAGAGLLNRLNGSAARGVELIVGTIVREEVGHVAFGSKWYHKLCNDQKLDIESDFRSRISKVIHRAPKKEDLDYDLRRQAGFLEVELKVLKEVREKSFIRKSDL